MYDGTVVWGDQLNAADAGFWGYAEATLGPALHRVASFARPHCCHVV
eukprot:COSAG06_NODE_364_length_16784_cov_21.917231_8_plen_47_part_00